jgi:hypothetical protein
MRLCHAIYWFCFWISYSAPLCCVLPESCWSCALSCASLSPVKPATVPPTVPATRFAMPDPKSLSWPWASWALPSAFCCSPWLLSDCRGSSQLHAHNLIAGGGGGFNSPPSLQGLPLQTWRCQSSGSSFPRCGWGRLL